MKLKNEKQRNLMKIILINLIIFVIVNLIYNIKYEQVDDFIIYNLYSGLDGTFNIHGVYIHSILCIIIGLFFRIIPLINWHTIFLLSMQFVCFTIIGYCIIDKHKNNTGVILYAIFASIFYTTLLLLIQYTSVAALLILTSFFMLNYFMEKEHVSKKMKILALILYTTGIMIRMQSLIIIAPFFLVYGVYYLIKYIKKDLPKDKLIFLIRNYCLLALITIIVYGSHYLLYQSNEVYKEYMEYNNIRATLHDMSYTDYEENKEIFDEIGWSKNDHYLFYTFNFGDENVYSKENLQKILDYKKSKNEYFNLNLNIQNVVKRLIDEMLYNYTFISSLAVIIFIIAVFKNREKSELNIITFAITIGLHMLFIILNRSMERVVIPGYIIGSVLLIYNMKAETTKDTKAIKENYSGFIISIIIVSIIFSASKYHFNYRVKDYTQYQELINYTNQHKENVYLYTVPSLQYRYLAYPVYTMPPKGAFSNLRVMGGWDMFTQNYYDFKERYQLEGTFLDVLKENVYVIDGDVNWSGNYYTNYIEHIVLFIKEHYNIDVEYKKIEEFDNIYIWSIGIGSQSTILE